MDTRCWLRYLRLNFHMTPFEAIEKIKALFAEGDAPAEAPAAAPEAPAPSEAPTEAAKEYDLKSGAKVSIDKLEIGGQVLVVDEAGNKTPAPAGTHELVDGVSITVDDMGIIAEISSPAEEAADVEATPSEADMKIAELEAQLSALKSEQATQVQKMSEQEAKFGKAIHDLSNVVLGLMVTPSADPMEAPKNKFSQHHESKDSKIAKYMDFVKQISK